MKSNASNSQAAIVPRLIRNPLGAAVAVACSNAVFISAPAIA